MNSQLSLGAGRTGTVASGPGHAQSVGNDPRSQPPSARHGTGEEYVPLKVLLPRHCTGSYQTPQFTYSTAVHKSLGVQAVFSVAAVHATGDMIGSSCVCRSNVKAPFFCSSW